MGRRPEAHKHHPTPLSGGDRKALAKELGKARDHLDRFVVTVIPHERADGVHRVEEKMRLDLQLERVQPRARERCVQLRRFDLALAISRVIIDRLQCTGDRRVQNQLDRQTIKEIRRDVDLRPRPGQAVVRAHRDRQNHPIRAVNDADHARREDVDQQVIQRGRHERKTARQPEDRRGEG